MKKILTSTLVTLLLAALLLPTLISCGETETPADETTAAAAVVTEESVPVEVTTADRFKDVNYNSTKFTWLVWKQSTAEYYGEEGTGDMIESAIFKRNAHVQEKLGVEFEYVEEDGNSSTFKTFCSDASNSIKGGTHAYDAMACYSRSASLLMTEGVLLNLLDVDYLDFDREYWPASLTELNTIGGKLYFASGDIATSLLYQMMFMVLNNDIAAERNIEGVQKKALEGGWTLDYMIEICKDTYVDNDPVGTRDTSDKYGLYIPGHTVLDIFYIGSGMKYVVLDSDGNAKLSDDYASDKSYDIIERLRTLIWTDGDGYYNTSAEVPLTTGIALISAVTGAQLQKYVSTAGYDYSILCCPKYNADQENYYTPVGFPHSMYCIPIDCNDKSMSGAVIELMGEESYNEVTPIVFDTAFKYRYTKSADDSTMFDIIRNGVVFDLGRTFFDQMGGDSSGPIRMWRNEIANNTSLLTTIVKKTSKNWQKQLDTAIEGIKNQG